MAPLAEGREVGVRVVRGVVIPMRGSEDDPRPTGTTEDVAPHPNPDPPAPAIAPPAGFRVPPAAIPEVVDHLPMWPSAAFAAALRPAEADHHR